MEIISERLLLSSANTLARSRGGNGPLLTPAKEDLWAVLSWHNKRRAGTGKQGGVTTQNDCGRLAKHTGARNQPIFTSQPWLILPFYFNNATTFEFISQARILPWALTTEPKSQWRALMTTLIISGASAPIRRVRVDEHSYFQFGHLILELFQRLTLPHSLILRDLVG